MVAVALGEAFCFLALSTLPNEGPILTAWRPGAGVQDTELLDPAMVGENNNVGPSGKLADSASTILDRDRKQNYYHSDHTGHL